MALNARQRHRRNLLALPLPHPFTGEDYECGFAVTYLPELVLVAASNAIHEKPKWLGLASHPSLFPYIAGRSLAVKNMAIPVLEFFGKSEFMEMEGGINEMYYSKRFQWLPTDFTVDAEGKVKLESYINNLHPVEHKAMYPVLEVILTLFIPKFEDYDHENISDFGDDDQADREWHWSRVPFPIKVPEFSPPTQPQRYDLRTGQNLQVIIKLANIELTSENPECTGGSWHVEGMANENIAASRIHYYHSENIAESWRNFRIYVKEPYYEQDDNNGCRTMYGLIDYETLKNPYMGS
ncbi:MAG: hypothetical protein BYD32DRAFT_469960 [Podila humilis]|nr:MAG: hypothetical protein BYD32DRAFT_469960 [Podila humilis]